MKVFVEAERGSNRRYRYNEDTLELEASSELLREYPYAYGFVVGSNTRELDSLDCFIISNRKIEHGAIRECEPIDVFILREDDEMDIKIIARLVDEEVAWSGSMKDEIDDFLYEVFKKFQDVRIEVGRLLGKKRAYEYIEGRGI